MRRTFDATSTHPAPGLTSVRPTVRPTVRPFVIDAGAAAAAPLTAGRTVGACGVRASFVQ
jgi:hypothetical protein